MDTEAPKDGSSSKASPVLSGWRQSIWVWLFSVQGHQEKILALIFNRKRGFPNQVIARQGGCSTDQSSGGPEALIWVTLVPTPFSVPTD
ncbi:hypothetical protein [Rhizobium leguminosarum]